MARLLLFLLFSLSSFSSFAFAQLDVGDTTRIPSSGVVAQSAGHEPLADCRRWPAVVLILEPGQKDAEEILRLFRRQFQFWRLQEVHFIWCAKAGRSEMEVRLADIPEGIEVVSSSGVADAWNKGYSDGFLYVLDAKGTIVWVGDAASSSEWSTQLKPVAARAKLDLLRWDSGPRDAVLSKAADFCRKKQLKKGWKETEKLLRSLDEGDERRALVVEFQADFEKEAAFRFAHLDTHAAVGCYELAWMELIPQLKLWAGTPMGDLFRDKERQWKKDRHIKKLRAWDRERIQALHTIWISGNRGKGLKDLREVASEATGSLLESVLASDLLSAQQI